MHTFVKTRDTFGSAYVFYPDMRLSGYVNDIIRYIEHVLHRQTFPVGAKFNLIFEAERISHKDFITWAHEPGVAEMSVHLPNVATILYDNSFDPFATPVPFSKSPTGYTYSLRGEDDEIIKIVYKR